MSAVKPSGRQPRVAVGWCSESPNATALGSGRQFVACPPTRSGGGCRTEATMVRQISHAQTPLETTRRETARRAVRSSSILTCGAAYSAAKIWLTRPCSCQDGAGRGPDPGARADMSPCKDLGRRNNRGKSVYNPPSKHPLLYLLRLPCSVPTCARHPRRLALEPIPPPLYTRTCPLAG